MTKRRLRAYIFDSISVILIIFGVVGSFGAFEAGSIGIVGLVLQSSLAICAVYGLNALRNASRKKTSYRKTYCHSSTASLPHLIKSA